MASERDKRDLVDGEYGKLSMSLLEGFKEQNSIYQELLESKVLVVKISQATFGNEFNEIKSPHTTVPLGASKVIWSGIL